ncbi:beta-ketoacyl-[acyl-carrier-protein] synthase family protein [Xanthomonas hydrangeae]|uniref:Nodulation protein E n=2 Tax=Xanthomonas hydrangeae TaxID=2775159 RepID=A0AAU0B7E0_9XANT|nr:beta-ketoacyl-[acyl-carrier-protein] synthase family protein [Xanthomonas hydrangeae]WOB47925.1 beta-ketoacyl-[acyl-carrier-protein] synthase family protein [Xanthomonas hydrangeae]
MQETFNRCLRGEGAIRQASPELCKWHPAAITAHIDRDFSSLLAPAERGFDRATQLALVASREAMTDSGLELDEDQRANAGVYCGIGLGGATTLESVYTRFYHRLFKINGETGDPTVVHPFTVTNTMPNAAASWISIFNGLKGPTQTYSVACASSAVAVGEAWRAIRHGYVESAVVVGTEAMLAAGPYLAWHALRVMAPGDAQDIAASCRPFSRDRRGFVLGEGAAAMVLETRERARKRGRAPYATLAGYGISSDATHITMPDSHGQARAIAMALKESRLAPERIGYINAHGTATQAGDLSETTAIKQVFGEHAQRLRISSTKAMHGHVIGAGGTLEFGIAVKALHQGVVPPTAYLREPDPALDLDYVAGGPVEIPGLSAVMSNSFAFGGTNVSLIATHEAGRDG